jgi:hypothetical protein
MFVTRRRGHTPGADARRQQAIHNLPQCAALVLSGALIVDGVGFVVEHHQAAKASAAARRRRHNTPLGGVYTAVDL